jgi:8-oxo-dGTP pyrophosphatase MutT (NUDIX family)
LTTLAGLLSQYQPEDIVEKSYLKRFECLYAEGDVSFSRLNGERHFTASGWITDEKYEHVLLIEHRKLGRWLQPGGHADGNSDLFEVCLKEVREETGLTSFHAEPKIFDLDIHKIPASKAHPSHDHYDVRFHIIADKGQRLLNNHEVLSVKWFELEEVKEEFTDPSIARMILKTLSLKHS